MHPCQVHGLAVASLPGRLLNCRSPLKCSPYVTNGQPARMDLDGGPQHGGASSACVKQFQSALCFGSPHAQVALHIVPIALCVSRLSRPRQPSPCVP